MTFNDLWLLMTFNDFDFVTYDYIPYDFNNITLHNDLWLYEILFQFFYLYDYMSYYLDLMTYDYMKYCELWLYDPLFKFYDLWHTILISRLYDIYF